MKLSRQWLTDFIDLTGISDEDLGRRLTDIGHAVESIEQHGDDTIFDLEITTNRVDAMSHLGMAREIAAALGRNVEPPLRRLEPAGEPALRSPHITIDVPPMCRRYTGLVIRGVSVKPSSERIWRRLESVGLRPINNIVDATNYVMMAIGHPLHAFDLDKLAGPAIVVRAGKPNETMKSLDGEMRAIDPQTVVIADAKRAVALGGIIGGFESEITDGTRNVLLECAWFTPSVVRRTARRLGLKTDASYRFERGVDPDDTIEALLRTAELIGGKAEEPIDVVAQATEPKTIRLRAARLREASGGMIDLAYARELFPHLGFRVVAGSQPAELQVTAPTFRGDIHEEIDLIEEVLRFYGLNRIPSSLPRLTVGDVRREPVEVAQDEVRDILIGCGLSEVINYSFIRREYNALFSSDEPVSITNTLSENVAAMRLSLLPGLLETVVFNRSYGNRDGAFFEIGRTYHRGNGVVREHARAALVMFGSIGEHWGEAKRSVDFFDAKGIIAQVAEKFHLSLTFQPLDAPGLKPGKAAVARHDDRLVASIGFVAGEVLQAFGIKGDVVAAEIDVEALIATTSAWTMEPVARFPGVPMILAVTHAPQLEYRQLIDTIRSFKVPHLHEVGLRDRFMPGDQQNLVKTTLGMWYQAFDRSLTQEEVSSLQQQLASRLVAALPVKLV